MNGIVASSFNSSSGIVSLGHWLHHFSTQFQWGRSMLLSGNEHIVEKAAWEAFLCNSIPFGNAWFLYVSTLLANWWYDLVLGCDIKLVSRNSKYFFFYKLRDEWKRSDMKQISQLHRFLLWLPISLTLCGSNWHNVVSLMNTLPFSSLASNNPPSSGCFIKSAWSSCTGTCK